MPELWGSRFGHSRILKFWFHPKKEAAPGITKMAISIILLIFSSFPSFLANFSSSNWIFLRRLGVWRKGHNASRTEHFASKASWISPIITPATGNNSLAAQSKIWSLFYFGKSNCQITLWMTRFKTYVKNCIWCSGPGKLSRWWICLRKCWSIYWKLLIHLLLPWMPPNVSWVDQGPYLLLFPKRTTANPPCTWWGMKNPSHTPI